MISGFLIGMKDTQPYGPLFDEIYKDMKDQPKEKKSLDFDLDGYINGHLHHYIGI